MLLQDEGTELQNGTTLRTHGAFLLKEAVTRRQVGATKPKDGVIKAKDETTNHKAGTTKSQDGERPFPVTTDDGSSHQYESSC